MRSVRRVALLAFAMVVTMIPAAAPAAAAPDQLMLSEVRIDQGGSDTDEYFELVGTPGASLDGVTYLVIGDGSGGGGVIEAVIPLDGVELPADGVLVVAEDSFDLTDEDVTANLNFENSDNVTHLIVDGFTGANGDDLDTDDDGTLDSTPWVGIIDALSLVESPTGGDPYYAGSLGYTDLGPDGSFVPAHVYAWADGQWRIGEFGLARTDTPGQFPNSVVPIVDCIADNLTLISSIQGAGASSPLTGQTVAIEGVVTGAFPDLGDGGITVQEESSDQDADPDTSEGVFVEFDQPFDFSLVEIGGLVQITGEVDEVFGNTQVQADDLALCGDGEPIAPTSLTLPADFWDREALEGMLVETTQDLTVTSLFTAYRFGELGVSVSGVLQQPTEVYEPGSPEAFALEDQNADDLLFIDDRGEFGNDNDPWFGAAGERAGDIVEAGVVGILYYSFGDHLLEPLEFPEVIDGSAPFSAREDAPALEGGNDIAAFNVLNYFNTFGNSEALRGARSPEEFDLQSAKIVEAILELDASILGLIELENDYEDLYDPDADKPPSIVTLVDQLNTAAGEDRYDWVVVPEALLTEEGLGGGGLGPDAIANGIIYQPDRVELVGEVASFDIDALLGGDDPDKNRWPLAASFDVDGQVVTVVVNHFKSKGSSCDDAIVPTGFGDGENDPQTASCDLVREYAAERLLEWNRTKPTGVESPDTFVIGDLNSYAAEDPIRIFEKAGYVDTIERYDDGAFTYKFDGRYGSLDYILASPSAKRLVDDAEVWQLNSAEPYGYLYFNDPIDTAATATPYASSDHDALVAAISKPGKGPDPGERPGGGDGDGPGKGRGHGERPDPVPGPNPGKGPKPGKGPNGAMMR